MHLNEHEWEVARSFCSSLPSSRGASEDEDWIPPPSKRQNRFNLFDSLSQSIQKLPKGIPTDGGSGNINHEQPKALAWYTCGPTTYAPAHMGHARTYVCFDIMRRVLEYQYDVTDTESVGDTAPFPPMFVMNITDVDDKILAAAAEAAASKDPENSLSSPEEDPETALELARRYEAEFWNDLDSLNCLRPHVVTRVTEHVESDIVPYIQRLVEQGMAYKANDGVYFHVRAYNEKLQGTTKYGKLAPVAASEDVVFETTRPAEMDSNVSTRPSNDKKDPRDFVLWKCRKPGESLWWKSPWGDGRPGWHIECSAMIEAVQRQFRDTHRFYVHAGGIDLKFPHHTNEIAQAEAFGQTGEWIPHWVHTGHLHIDGLKMSKSLKNFVSIQEFLSSSLVAGNESTGLECPADDFRLWCLGLSGSYRGPATFSTDQISQARAIRQKIARFLMDGEDMIETCDDIEFSSRQKKWREEDCRFLERVHQCQQKAISALSNDLDGSTFLKELVLIAEYGMSHLGKNASSHSSVGPMEPVQAVVDIMRRMLALVGFSEKTTRVGMREHRYHSYENDSSMGNVVGGEVALTDELVRFRSAVRKLALEDAHNKTASQNMKEILALCDSLRDTALPEMGIEVSDGKSDRDDEGVTKKQWQFCFPTSAQSYVNEESRDADVGSAATKPIDLTSIPLEDLFRVGPYDGMFSDYTDDGIPTTNSDGTDVSKRLLKKLLKKRDTHKKRLESAATATSVMKK